VQPLTLARLQACPEGIQQAADGVQLGSPDGGVGGGVWTDATPQQTASRGLDASPSTSAVSGQLCPGTTEVQRGVGSAEMRDAMLKSRRTGRARRASAVLVTAASTELIISQFYTVCDGFFSSS